MLLSYFKYNKKGFSLIEVLASLMIVVVILSIAQINFLFLSKNNLYKSDDYVYSFYNELRHYQNLSMMSKGVYVVDLLSDHYRVSEISNSVITLIKKSKYKSGYKVTTNVLGGYRLMFDKKGSLTSGGCSVWIDKEGVRIGTITILPITGRIKIVE